MSKKRILKEAEVPEEIQELFQSLLEDLQLVIDADSNVSSIKESLGFLNNDDIITTQQYNYFLSLADKIGNSLDTAVSPAGELMEAVEKLDEETYQKFDVMPDIKEEGKIMDKDVADTLFGGMGDTLMESLGIKQDALDDLKCEDLDVLGSEVKEVEETIPTANDAVDDMVERMGDILMKDLGPVK